MKKTISTFLLIFIFSTAYSQNSVIGTKIVLGNLEIAQFDFPTTMEMNEANKACNDLGNGWRLPTINELDEMYQYRDKITGFKGEKDGIEYWSSSKKSSETFWIKSFKWGTKFGTIIFDGMEGLHVRAVRTKQN
ncbi:MAG: DUF1566 domain-containing protein [Bacteroidota bacterium]|nr:DUF1566 domain-containing protein [Bacteroidota bacterium]